MFPLFHIIIKHARCYPVRTALARSKTTMALNLKKVLVTDGVDKCCKEILEKNGIAADLIPKLSHEELLAKIPDYDALVVRSASKVSADVLEAGKNLKIVGRAGVGVDNVDIPTASKKGVIVMNTPGGNTLSAVEQTCVLIASLARHIPQAAQSMKEGKWDRKKYMGSELYNKTLGIVGLGRIGREVALRMQSFGMRTIGYDPLVPAEEAATFNVEFMELEQMWPQIDYVTVHVPLIPATKDMINDEVFAKCKKGVYVVNVARGGVISEEAMLRALESGQCGGAGLDVYSSEPPKGDVLAKLVQHPNAICVPHLGASTSEAQNRVAEEIAQQFADASCGKSLFGHINAMALSNALSPETAAWVSLAEKLGKIAASLCGGDVKTVAVKTQGCLLKDAASYMTAAVAVGLFKSNDPAVNLVSGPVLAKEHGSQISASHAEGQDPVFTNTVTVTAQGAQGKCELVGSVAGGSVQVLTRCNDAVFANAVILYGNLSLFSIDGHPSKVLGPICAKLDSAGIYLNGFYVGCDGHGKGGCFGVLNTSGPLTFELSAVAAGAKTFPQVSL